MPTEPVNLQVNVEAHTSRKWQAPLNDNGEPVTVPKKRMIAAAAPPKPPPPKKRTPPNKNTGTTVEAPDGSDDDLSDMDVDRSDEDAVEILEKPKEDAEAELSMCLFKLPKF
jgi:hypothetical protein